MDRLLLVACLAVVTVACGARSELVAGRPNEDVVVAAEDAGSPFVPPDCGVPIQPGTVRFRLDGVVGRGAADSSGNIYVPVATPDGGRGVRSVDPCGNLRWETAVLGGASTRDGTVRLTTRGEVLLTDVRGDRGVQHVARLDSDGTMRGFVDTDTVAARTIAVPVGDGPIIATVGASTRLVDQLDRFSFDARPIDRITDWSNANECAVSNGIIGCHERAWEIATSRSLWRREFEILDGTLRHVVGTAIVGERVYSFFFGISSFVLEANNLRTGASVYRAMLARSTTGQQQMLAGAPVVRADGEVFVYLRVGGPGGRLIEVSPSGAIVRTVSAESSTEYFDDAGSVALGADGTVFLAVGSAVTAFDETLHERWRLATGESVDRAWTMLTPAGDLLVHTASNQLLAIASGSPGLPAAGWPLGPGDARNGNAR